MADPIPLEFPPGVVKTQSALASKGRYIDCDGIRFWQGKPEKIGGQVALSTAAVIGYPRGMGSWNDLTGRQLVSLGTVTKLYCIPNDTWTPIDITPLLTVATLANPFTTTNGSSIVTVAWNAHGGVVGQYADFSNTTAFAGLPALNGSFLILAVTANTFTFDCGTVATAGATGGGAAVSAGLELLPGVQDPAVGYGWGAGAWGADYWGTPRSVSNITFTPRYWSLGHFGKILLACYLSGGIYSWDPTTFPTPRAAIVPNAPTVCTGFVMTSDYIMIAFGTNYGGTQNLMQWWACAQGDYTNWDVTAIAGPQGTPSVEGILSDGTEIVGGADIGNHVTLLLTDTCVYAFQYTGSQYVFDIQRVGKECGLIGPLAIVVVDSTAYWVSNNNFYMYNGSVAPIPNQNDILRWVFDQIPNGYGIKIVASYNSKHKEVWFSFTGANGGDPYLSVVYNTEGGFWFPVYSIGFSSATRLSGGDNRPIYGKTSGYIYQAENGLDVVGHSSTKPQNWFLIAPPTEMGAGKQLVTTDMMIADNERQTGNVTVELSTYDRSPANPTLLDQGTVIFGAGDGVEEIRVSGRQIQAEWSGSGLGCDIRMGIWKVSVQPSGMRP